MSDFTNDDYLLNSPNVRTGEPEDEWKIQRLGSVTGSLFGKFVKKSGDDFKLSTSKTSEDLIYKIAWERLLKEGNVSEGLGRMSFSSKPTDHGLTYESDAISLYQIKTGSKVESAQRYVNYSEWIGGTPDGFIGEDGLIEVKSPYNGGNHLRTLLTGEIYNPEFIYQIQGYLMITGRKWCDFITYDPDLVDSLQLSINRIERDEHIIKGIEKVLEMVVEKIQDIISKTLESK